MYFRQSIRQTACQINPRFSFLLSKEYRTVFQIHRFIFLTLALFILGAALPNKVTAQDGVTYADQGPEWTESERAAFYTQDQGSRIMPLSWMRALKQENGDGFLSDALTRFGYLENPATPGIPVGFSVANHNGQPSIGMTCSACHTREIHVHGERLRLDGGPGIVDFQSFLTTLNYSMGIVVNDPTEFADFSEKVLGEHRTPEQEHLLEESIGLWHLRFNTLVERALPTIPWGPSRLDAVSMIFNRLAGLDIGEPPTYLIPENIEKANAPTRYPFLWNAARQDFTQWPGFAKNGNDLFGLARNLGEVYGVFAEFHPEKSSSLFRTHDYLANNSANFSGLRKVEKAIWKIGPPRWRWELDQALADSGREIFDRSETAGGCADCHGIKRGEPRFGTKSTWKTPIQDVGTDTRECEILLRTVKTGVLEGAKLPVVGDKLKAEEPVFKVLTVAVVNSILQEGISALDLENAAKGTFESSAKDIEYDLLISRNQDVESVINLEAFQEQIAANITGGCKYESRVMEGIWAAAPYLHNGSVRTLEELLKPANEREADFMLGPDYDIEAVGMSKTQTAFGYTLHTTDCNDIASGNSRCGHEYGTDLTENEKRALLEYLKSL